MAPATDDDDRAAAFQGYQVVAGAFVVLFVVYGIQFSFGTFLEDITEDTGWPRSRIQLIFSLYVLGYSALSAMSGSLTDRLGPQRVIGGGAVILATGYLLWSQASSLWLVLLGLGVIAPIGMSASWVPCNATVVRWFVRRRGLAVAVTTAGGSLANIVVPPVAALLVDAWGWRSALATMAGVGGVVMLLAATRMARDPESRGQRPDGDAPGAAFSIDTEPLTGFTPGQAMRQRAYWQILGMYALSFTVVFVPFVHVVDFAKGLGAGSVIAATVVSAIGVGGLAGRLIAGSLSDVLGRRHVAVTAFTLETAAFVAMGLAGSLVVLYPAAVLFGVAYGATVTLLPALVGDHFGRAHAGAIVGRVFATAGSMAAFGPYVAQLLLEATDSYRIAFLLSAGLNAGALLLAVRLPEPHGDYGSRAESLTTAT
ncbi:MAG: MFS transporter [Actinomycetota bacterium]